MTPELQQQIELADVAIDLTVDDDTFKVVKNPHGQPITINFLGLFELLNEAHSKGWNVLLIHSNTEAS